MSIEKAITNYLKKVSSSELPPQAPSIGSQSEWNNYYETVSCISCKGGTQIGLSGPCCVANPPSNCKCIGWYMHRRGPKPSNCPSIEEMDADGYSQAEWLSVRNNWASMFFVYWSDPLWSIESSQELLVSPPPDTSYILDDPNVHSLSWTGVNGITYSQFWSMYWSTPKRVAFDNDGNGVPSVYGRMLWDIGCFGRLPETGGACCSPAGDFEGFSCTQVSSASSCDGEFYPGQTCDQIGGDNCGAAAGQPVNQNIKITELSEVETKNGINELVAAAIKRLKQ